MTVSIIIAVKTWQKNLEECVAKCLELDFTDFEIIILPDDDTKGLSPSQLIQGSPKGTVPVNVIPTGPVSPAQKRDLALNYAHGEFFAFLDDDAYPAKDWLKNAIKNFTDPRVAAVGGPAQTPATDTLKQKASGEVYSSFLVSGPYSYRYIPKKKILVDDFPSCNFIIRKSIFQEIGGFNTKLWPGEDTKLCLDITKKLGKIIVYDPQVLVFHHRRSLFIPHLNQIASYALHRGYFVKRYPQTSLRLAYFIPSIFLLLLLVGATLALFYDLLREVYLTGIFLYLFLIIIFSLKKDLRLAIFKFLGIISTHLAYGIYFIKGLLSAKLTEEVSAPDN